MDKQSGYMMLIIALLLVVITGFSSAFVAMITTGTNASISSISANYAYGLAQAGIEEGSYQLALGACNSAWSAITTLPGQGEYQYACNNYTASTTTTSALTASAITIPLTSVANLASFGSLIIDSEMLYYDGISGNNLTNARRGQNGTTAATHTLGAIAKQSQYIISSRSGAPSLSAPNGKMTLYQAVLLANMTYYAAGTNGSNAIILYYNGFSWSTALTGPLGLTFFGMDVNLNNGQIVGFNNSNQSYIYTFNGSTWAYNSGPLTSLRFQGVACDNPLNPNTCWIVGQRVSPGRGLMYQSGTAYSSSRNFTLTGISCINGSCVAVGDHYIEMFASNSTTPFTNENSGLSTNLTDVHCPQSNRCVATQSTGKVYYYNGASWSAFQISPASLNGVHCPSTNSCFVVGTNGLIFNCTLPILASSSCTAQATPGPLNLLSVHCNTNNDCLAVGSSSSGAYRYTGGFWTIATLPASYTLNAVSGFSGVGSGVITPIVLRNH